MPLGDGTGPGGMGPMTGRAAGYCAGYPVPGFGYQRGGTYTGATVPYYVTFPYTGFYPAATLPWGRGRFYGYPPRFGRGFGRGRGRW